MSADQATAMMDLLRRQVEELANTLEQSRQETSDLRAQTDRSIQHLQDQCDAARAACGGCFVCHVQAEPAVRPKHAYGGLESTLLGASPGIATH